MYKHHQLIIRPLPGDLIQYLKALLLQTLDLSGNIRHLESDVVDPFAPAFYKTCHRAVRMCGFKQFHLVRTRPEKGGPDTFRGHFLLFIAPRSKELFKEPAGCLQILYSNPYMFYFQHYLGFCHEFTQ